jgi:hypothetical protein
VESIEAGLDEILSLQLGDERLKLGGSEGVDKSSFGCDKKSHLGAGQGRSWLGILPCTGAHPNPMLRYE